MAYVYRHIRLDKNEPFYIGIGNDDNGKYTRAFDGACRRKSSKIWNSINNKTLYSVEILMDNLTWEDACEKEKEFINIYGRIDNATGILANMTDGGEGVLGIRISKETLNRMAESRRGIPQSPESNLKRSNSLRGIKRPIEVRNKISISNMGRVISVEQRDKLSKINKGRIVSEETKKKIKLTRSTREYVYVGRKKTLEERIKISIAHKGKPHPWQVGKKPSLESIKKMSDACSMKKPVLQYDLNNNLIMRFESQKSASEYMGGNFKKEDIGRACRGVNGYKNNRYKGFIWKHEN